MDHYYEEEHLRKYEPYPFIKESGEENNKRVFGVLGIEEIKVWDDGDSAQIHVNVSLFNKRMLDEEYEALESKENPLFFYEFSGELTSDVRKEYVLGRDNYYDLRDIFGFRPYFDRRYLVFRIIDLEDQEGAIEIQGDHLTFIGDLLFSASPVLVRKVGIVLEDVLIKGTAEERKLNAIFSKWNDEIKKSCIRDDAMIKSELNYFFSPSEICTSINLYNVGQTNCCYCDLGHKKMFFDIGVTRSSEDLKAPLIDSALTEISKLDIDAVMLSHWDMDHILGVCYNQKCLNNKLWIVPDFDHLYYYPPVAVRRVCNYLLKVGRSKVLMLNTCQSNKQYFASHNDQVSIYLGEPKAANGINKANNGGLLMGLQNRRTILLPGDCENSMIPNAAVAKQYDYVVVPHHGSVMSGPRMKADPRGRRTAYICDGKITGNFSPDFSIVQKYHRAGFHRVHATKNLKINNKYVISL